jgi:hypothetical protein
VKDYTQLANRIVDSWVRFLSGSETKFLLYVVRQTVGWHKERATFSYSDAAKQLGISIMQARRAAETLEVLSMVGIEHHEKNEKDNKSGNIYWIRYQADKPAMGTDRLPDLRKEQPPCSNGNSHPVPMGTIDSKKDKESKDNYIKEKQDPVPIGTCTAAVGSLEARQAEDTTVLTNSTLLAALPSKVKSSVAGEGARAGEPAKGSPTQCPEKAIEGVYEGSLTLKAAVRHIREVQTKSGVKMAVFEMGEYKCKVFNEAATNLLAKKQKYEGSVETVYGHFDNKNELIVEGHVVYPKSAPALELKYDPHIKF